MQTWLGELEEWEMDKKGHADDFLESMAEIKRFVDDPMFDGLSVKDKEAMKSNLVFFIKQIC